MITFTTMLVWYVAIGCLAYLRIAHRWRGEGFKKFAIFAEKNLGRVPFEVHNLLHIGVLLASILFWPYFLTDFRMMFTNKPIDFDKAFKLLQDEEDKRNN